MRSTSIEIATTIKITTAATITSIMLTATMKVENMIAIAISSHAETSVFQLMQFVHRTPLGKTINHV